VDIEKGDKAMKKVAICFLVTVFVVGLLAAGCPAPSGPTQAPAPVTQQFKWRLVGATVESDAIFQNQYRRAAAMIEEGSGGRISCTAYPVGPIVSLEEQVSAIQSGSIEAAIIIPGYAASVAPATLTGEMAYNAKDGYDDWEIHLGWGVNKMLRENYAKGGIYFAGVTYAAMIHFFSTFPINTVDDFKGKPVWLSPSLFFLTDFGIVPTEMPGFDPYMATKMGTIKGFSYSSVNLEAMKLKEVCPYFLMPGFFPASTHLIINQKAWDALGPDLQRQVQNYLDAHLHELIPMGQKLEDDAIAKAKAYGTKFITLPDSEMAKLIKSARASEDKLPPDAAKIVAVYRDWVKYNKVWEYK